MHTKKLWSFNYVYLLCLSALTAIAFQMISPVLPKFAVGLGASLTTAGTIAGLFSITALIIRPVSGLIADRFNQKWLMVGATAAIALSVLCYTLAENISILFLFRIIHGIAFAISGTTNIAFASSFIPKERMGEGISYLGLGQILATAIGPNISVWTVENLGYHWTFVLSFIVAGLAAILMVFIKCESPKSLSGNTRLRVKLSDLIAVKLIPYAVFGGLFSLANGLVSSFIVLLGDERGITNVGIFFTCNAIMLLVIRPFGGKLNDRKGIAFILIPSYIFAAAAMAMLAGANAVWMIAAAGILKAVGQGMGQPSVQAECIRMLPEKRGVATSTYYIGADVGQGVGPIIGGAISSAFGYGTMYMSVSLLMLLGMACFLLYKKWVQAKTPEI